MLRLYVANSTENPLGWKPWNSRLQQGANLGAYFKANFAVPDPNEVGARLSAYYNATFAVPGTHEIGPRLSADFPNFAASRPAQFRTRDWAGAPVPHFYRPPELTRAGLGRFGWLGQDEIALNPTMQQIVDGGTGIPFDPAEFPVQANPVMPSPDNPTPVIPVNPVPVRPCPAWGCGGPRTAGPVTFPPTSTGSGGTTTAPGNWQTIQQQFAAMQAQQLAAQQALIAAQQAAAAAAVATPIPNATTAATTTAATVSPDYVGEVESWLTQQTLINGIPNWAIGAGVVGVLLFLHKKSGR